MIQYFLMIQFSLVVVFDGSFCREAMPSHFKFKEYCPIVFRNLRERFGIDDHDYMVNITSDIDAITYIDRDSRTGKSHHVMMAVLTEDKLSLMHCIWSTPSSSNVGNERRSIV